MCRDTGELDGDELAVVTALRVFWTQEAAHAERKRLIDQDMNEDHFYYCEATEVARK